MQAGASDRGLTFAGKWAALIFTHQQEKSLMQEFYAQVNDQVRSSGRDPRACAILPSIGVIAGTSQAAADERAALLDSFAMRELAIGTHGRLIRRARVDGWEGKGAIGGVKPVGG